MDKIQEFNRLLEVSKNIVFFGGAGVSTESGIPDFRGKDGYYNMKYSFPPEEILSKAFFESNPEEFFKFYYDKMLCYNAKPSVTHNVLAAMESSGKLKAVVTQNIDGLHQKAGSKNVFELHGSIYRNHCVKCGKAFDLDYIKANASIPVCDRCGGIIKPDVVLYGENLDDSVIFGAVNSIAKSDLLIVGGTSLTVYPAAGFVNYAKGRIVIINYDCIETNREADIVINQKLGEVFSQVKF